MDKFANKCDAWGFIQSLGYTYDHHEPWGFTGGVDFFNGPTVQHRGAVHQSRGLWHVWFYRREGKS